MVNTRQSHVAVNGHNDHKVVDAEYDRTKEIYSPVDLVMLNVSGMGSNGSICESTRRKVKRNLDMKIR
jgi:hypothetical protein